jgi:hypothetical protein
MASSCTRAEAVTRFLGEQFTHHTIAPTIAPTIASTHEVAHEVTNHHQGYQDSQGNDN